MAVRSAPVVVKVSKRDKTRSGRMPWAQPIMRRSVLDMAVVGNLPLLLRRHLFLLHRADKLDTDLIARRGCIDIDFFGDAKGDGFRAMYGHCVMLSLHLLCARNAQALEAWPPVGVAQARNQQQSTIEMMFRLGDAQLGHRIAALDGQRVNVGDASYPIRVNVLGDGAWMRQVCRRSGYNPEIPVQPCPKTWSFFKGMPCFMCDITFEEVYSATGVGVVADVSRGDPFLPLILLPRIRFFYGPMHGLANTLGGVVATIGRMYAVLVRQDLQVTEMIDKVFYSARAAESWDIFFQRQPPPESGEKPSRSSKHSISPVSLAVEFVRGGSTELREVMCAMEPQLVTKEYFSSRGLSNGVAIALLDDIITLCKAVVGDDPDMTPDGFEEIARRLWENWYAVCCVIHPLPELDAGRKVKPGVEYGRATFDCSPSGMGIAAHMFLGHTADAARARGGFAVLARSWEQGGEHLNGSAANNWTGFAVYASPINARSTNLLTHCVASAAARAVGSVH